MLPMWPMEDTAPFGDLLTHGIVLVLGVILAKSYMNIWKVCKHLYTKGRRWSTKRDEWREPAADENKVVERSPPEHEGVGCKKVVPRSKDIPIVNKYQPAITLPTLNHRIAKDVLDDEELLEKHKERHSFIPIDSDDLPTNANNLQCRALTPDSLSTEDLNLVTEEPGNVDTDVENCSDHDEVDEGHDSISLVDQCSIEKLKNEPSCKSSNKPSADKYGSVDIELEDQVFSLRTESDDYAEHQNLPDDLVDLIADTCFEKDVRSPMLYQCDQDPSVLLLTGVSAEDAQATIQKKLKERFNGFRLFAQNIRAVTDGMVELSDVSDTFLVKKYDLSDGIYVRQATATCELILKGMFRNTCKRYEGYLAIVPAHFILTREECLQLKTSQGNRNLIKQMERNVAERIADSRFDLSLFNSAKQLDLRLKPPMLAYRHCRQEEDGNEGFKHHTAFMNDTVLFELETREPMSEQDHLDVITPSDMEKAMKRKQDSHLDIIFPLRDPKVLATMGRKRVCVKVGPTEGHMIMSGINLLERGVNGLGKTGGSSLLHHIRLVVKSPLHNGHSGSIIYVIDKNNGRLYRFGMLIAELEMLFHSTGKHIYQGVVLRQVIDEIEHRYSHVIHNLRPVGQHNCQDMTGRELVDDLLMKGPEHHYPFSRARDEPTSDDDQDLSFSMHVDDDGPSSDRPSFPHKAVRWPQSVRPAMQKTNLASDPSLQCPYPGLHSSGASGRSTPIPPCKDAQCLPEETAGDEHHHHKDDNFPVDDSGFPSSLQMTYDTQVEIDDEESPPYAQGARGNNSGEAMGY